MPNLDFAVSFVINHLLVVKPTLNPAAVEPNSSLTADLGFDSLELVELGNRLTEQYRSIDLAPWLATAMDPGGDRVASLAAYLLDHIQASGAETVPASGDGIATRTESTPGRPL